ncbi:MAG: redox-regulated ATPase YchF [Candidatus Roizmanbacteria bacterium]
MSSKLSLGIVGLPNVGKSTLFNALLKKQIALAANYPFATIEPNIGVVDVPDERLAELAKVVGTQKIVPAIIEFYDIAGLVKGASQGEGLGNQFLSHIREASAIVYVCRLFEDKEIIHVYDSVDAIRDLSIVKSELIFADIQTLEKQNERKPPVLPPSINIKVTPELWKETITLCKTHLNAGNPLNTLTLNDEENVIVKMLNLITLKREIYVFNLSEPQLKEYQANKDLFITKYKLEELSDKSIMLNAKLESDLASFAPDEAAMLLDEYHLKEPGLNILIKKAYQTLGLMSYLTAGEIEVRAWTIPIGATAVEAAGVIHTDFIKGFVKAEIFPYRDFIALGGWAKGREQGKVIMAGRDYIMQDGDVADFKIANT